MENKGYGGAPAVATSRGKCHRGKMRAALAWRLTARASGCSRLARWLKRQRGAPRPSPYSSCPSEAARHREQCGDAGGTQWAVWIGRYYSSGTGLPVCHGFADLLWQEVTWHRHRASGITMILFYFVFTLFSFFFHISVSMNKNTTKKGKSPSVFGTVTFLFFQVFGFLCFNGLLVWSYTVLKKGTKYQFKGKKTAIMPTNILFYCISVVFTCFCLKTNTWIYMYVCICII